MKRSYSRDRRICQQSKRRKLEIGTGIEIIKFLTIRKPLTSFECKYSTKITDLNDDCLELIFMRLNVQDFFNVAASNTRLNRSAGLVYRRWHKKKTIILETNVNKTDSIIDIGLNVLLINGLKQCLWFLRSFGPYITNIGLKCNDSTNKKIALLTHYLNEYCAESLMNITFQKTPRMLSENMRKPYQNVNHIYINESQLIQQLPQFNEWFPNLRRLELVNNTFDMKYADVHFPCLEEFRFFAICPYRSRFSLKKYLAVFLKSNSHIQSVQMDIEMGNAKFVLKFNEILSFMKDNSTITTLKSHHSFGCEIGENDLNLLATTIPSLTEIDFRGYTFQIPEIILFIHQMKYLKKFRFGLSETTSYEHFRAQFVNDRDWQFQFTTLKFNRIITITRLL